MTKDERLLAEFESHKVTTTTDTDTLQTTIEDALAGAGFYPNVKDGKYSMTYIDDSEIHELGTTLEEALNSLSDFTEYFSSDTWAHNF